MVSIFITIQSKVTDSFIGSQSLVGTMVSYDQYHILQSRPLPVPKGHTLRWVGISEQGVSPIPSILRLCLIYNVPPSGSSNLRVFRKTAHNGRLPHTKLWQLGPSP